MSTGQLLLTLLVALLVFGPDKLPMLARHLGRIFVKFNGYKQLIIQSWQKQLQQDIKEQQLMDNTKKAQKADASYTER